MDQRKSSRGDNSPGVALVGRIPGTCVGKEIMICEQLASSPDAPPAKPVTETEPAGSIPSGSESADPLTDKSSELPKVREPASTGLVTGAASVGHWNRGAVLSEAVSFTEWYKVIERKDCIVLMRLLEHDSALIHKTGEAGRTVLHVAAIQGCFELVDTIQQIFSSGNVNAEFAQQLLAAIDVRCAMTAADIAFHILGNTEVGYAIRNICDSCLTRERRSPPWLTGKYSLTQEQINRVQQIIDEVVTEGTNEGRYKGLKKSFKENVDYNFCSSLYGDMFLFHHACSPFYESRVADRGTYGEDFVEDVIKRCRKVGEELIGEERIEAERIGEERLMELMKLQDVQGRTPLHVAVAASPDRGRDDVLQNLMRCLKSERWVHGRIERKSTEEYMDVRNARGWTPLHVAATQPHSDIFWELMYYGDSSVQLARISQDLDFFGNYEGDSLDNCTALHLAVLHNNPKFVDQLFEYRWWGGQEFELLARGIWLDPTHRNSYRGWTPMSLALLLRNVDIVEIILRVNKEKHLSTAPKLHSGGAPKLHFGTAPVLHLGAALGNPEILRQLMNDLNLDPLGRDNEGQTTLHYAANGLIQPSSLYDTRFHHRPAKTYVCFADIPNVAWLDYMYACPPQEGRNDNVRGYSARKGCINMLLQEGVDMWQKNDDGKIANPGRQINDDEFISWWHEKIAKETLDIKNNLNQGGNAISVIGALIATASYVGPLQPPLSYGVDPSLQLSPTLDSTSYARIWDLPVRIFMLSNSLSFYLAIASIMLAVVPSLPMPQESLLKELERTRKTVASAICVLLLSVVGNLVSYAAASVAVMPEHNSWRNVGLTAYPALVGGFACLIGILLFIIRVLRLIYPSICRRSKNNMIRVFDYVTNILMSGFERCTFNFMRLLDRRN